MKNRAFGNKLICPGLSLNSQANKHLSLPQGLRANIEFGSERIPRRLLWGEASEYPNGITPYESKHLKRFASETFNYIVP